MRSNNKKFGELRTYIQDFENAVGDSALFAGFKQELADLGYVEGKHVIIDQRQAEGHSERLPELARELIALHPDGIVCGGNACNCRRSEGDLNHTDHHGPRYRSYRFRVRQDLCSSRRKHHGGRKYVGDLTAKSLEVLHTILPAATKIAVQLSSNQCIPAYTRRRATL